MTMAPIHHRSPLSLVAHQTASKRKQENGQFRNNSRHLNLVVCVLFALFVSACTAAETADATDEQQPANQLAEPDFSPVGDPATLSNDPSGDELGQVFGGGDCEGMEGGPANDFFALTEQWWEVEALLETQREHRESAEAFAFSGRDTASEDRAFLPIDDMFIHGSHRPGMEWALANGGTVFLGGGDNFGGSNEIGVVVATNAAGEVFLPGTCIYVVRQEPLQRFFGDRFNATMLEAVYVTGSGLEQVLRVDNDSVEPDPGPPVVGFGITPDELVDSFQVSVISVSFDRPLDDRTLCTKTKSGWNECMMLTESLNGATLIAFIDPGTDLEIWLMDENAILENPIRLLGTVPTGQYADATYDLGIVVDLRLSAVTDSEDSSNLIASFEIGDYDQLAAFEPAEN